MQALELLGRWLNLWASEKDKPADVDALLTALRATKQAPPREYDA